MASATIHEKEVVKPVNVSRIMLELTVGEAEVLQTILYSIAGSTKTSLRGICDDVCRALTSVGVWSVDGASGIITFADGSMERYKEDGHEH
jgi:hypothetical protein